jgi:hypothetical protein
VLVHATARLPAAQAPAAAHEKVRPPPPPPPPPPAVTQQISGAAHWQPPAPPSPAAIASDPLPLLLPLVPPPLPELLEPERPLSLPVLLLLVDPPQAAASVMPVDNTKNKRAFFIRSTLGEPVVV